ncbi:hypothetical protein B0H17DRAFT_1235506 [Mycena rosella]|uniref:Uncharacterized protein n=1 Tax=Mycena rosella TaxID=1033263 RepID=A0AAD7G8P7_MYCRO|nr:hypothetical protein B0H17DRAFT_1235506 [Mycena rosella]
MNWSRTFPRTTPARSAVPFLRASNPALLLTHIVLPRQFKRLEALDAARTRAVAIPTQSSRPQRHSDLGLGLGGGDKRMYCRWVLTRAAVLWAGKRTRAHDSDRVGHGRDASLQRWRRGAGERGRAPAPVRRTRVELGGARTDMDMYAQRRRMSAQCSASGGRSAHLRRAVGLRGRLHMHTPSYAQVASDTYLYAHGAGGDVKQVT